MFKFLKKNALRISLTIGALIAVGLGVTWAFPTQVSAVLTACGNFFRAAGNTIADWFGKGAAAAATAEPPVEVTIEPTPAAA